MFFKKIVCLLIGHRWKYIENGIANEIDFVCSRCGKVDVIKLFKGFEKW